jgi:hypothetical protein
LKAATEAERQANLFEQSFLRLERPYLYIFDVSRFEGSSFSPARVGYCVAKLWKNARHHRNSFHQYQLL